MDRVVGFVEGFAGHAKQERRDEIGVREYLETELDGDGGYVGCWRGFVVVWVGSCGVGFSMKNLLVTYSVKCGSVGKLTCRYSFLFRFEL